MNPPLPQQKHVSVLGRRVTGGGTDVSSSASCLIAIKPEIMGRGQLEQGFIQC